MPDEAKFLIEFLDGEMTRFWTAFNIFFAIQIAAIFGFVKTARFLLANRPVLHGALCMMVLFSALGALSLTRGWDLQRSLVKTLSDVETRVDADHRLLEPVKGHSFLPTNSNTFLASIFGWFCVYFWIAAWRWLKRINYELVFPNRDQIE